MLNFYNTLCYIFGPNGFHSHNICCSIISCSGYLLQVTLHNDTRCNGSQHNDTQDNDIQHTVLSSNNNNGVKLGATF